MTKKVASALDWFGKSNWFLNILVTSFIGLICYTYQDNKRTQERALERLEKTFEDRKLYVNEKFKDINNQFENCAEKSIDFEKRIIRIEDKHNF